MNSASIALAAVRNRLRILGKSDADIAAIEATPDLLHAGRRQRGPRADRRHGGAAPDRARRRTSSAPSAGATNPVFMIGDLSKVWLVANVREEDAPLICTRAIRWRCACWPFRAGCSRRRLTYVGAVDRCDTHRLPVRAEVENPDGDAEAGDVRQLPHHHRRGRRRIRRCRRTRWSTRAIPAHVWVANRQGKTLAIRPIRPGAARTAWSRCWPG